MGKWLYINLFVVLVSIVFMFIKFSVSYDAGWVVYFLGSVFWLALLFCGYYIYVYRMKNTINTQKGAVAVKKPKANRPEVKLNRPKVKLNKNKNQQNDE